MDKRMNPYVSARIGKNPAYPFEVQVGIMVRMFDNREEALHYAIRQNRECIKDDVEKLERQIRELGMFEGFDILMGYE